MCNQNPSVDFAACKEVADNIMQDIANNSTGVENYYPAAVLYALYINVLCSLLNCGWSEEELTNALQYYSKVILTVPPTEQCH